jgi:Ni/Co efflux regulator RcnB
MASSAQAQASSAVSQSKDQRPDQRSGQRDQDHRRFNDNDRQMVHGWYQQHQRALPAGLRDRDRLEPNLSARIDVGRVLDRELRGHAHTVPADLLRRLPAAPRGDRYFLVDGQLCLVDSGYQVQDVIRVSGWWGS